jgi:hypothetical protein
MRSLPILLSLILVSGCAAGRSTYFLWTAEREFMAATELEADQRAVYEYTMAHEHLLKAREEHGYSDYSTAEEMAKAATEWSSKASAVAEYGTTERDLMLQEMGEEVPDAANTVEEDYETPLGITEE